MRRLLGRLSFLGISRAPPVPLVSERFFAVGSSSKHKLTAWAAQRHLSPRVALLGLLGALVAGGAAITAVAVDSRDGSLNLLTEVFGMVSGAVLTVAVIESRRRRREAADAARLRDERLHAELTENLSRMVLRVREGVLPMHRMMTSVRKDVTISPDQIRDVDTRVPITADQRTQLLMAIVPRLPASRISTTAIVEALLRGEYLKIDEDGELEQTPIHVRLGELLRVHELLGRDEGDKGILGDWAKNLLTDLEGTSSAAEYWPRAVDILRAQGYYDQMEDLFNIHAELCGLLVGDSVEAVARGRSPISVLGDQEGRRIAQERVEAPDIRKLVTGHIWPFGDRVLRTAVGQDTNEQVQTLWNAVRSEVLRQLGSDAPELTQRLALTPGVRKTLEQMLDDRFAQPDEGLEGGRDDS